MCLSVVLCVCVSGGAGGCDGVPLRQSVQRAPLAHPHPQEQPGPRLALRLGTGEWRSPSSSLKHLS